MRNTSSIVVPYMLLAAGCGVGHEPKTEEVPFVPIDLTVEESASSDDGWIAGLNLFDPNLLEFAKNELVPGNHTWSVKYKYKPLRDTLLVDPSDSIIVYSYPVDSILAYYRAPFEWTVSERERSDVDVKKSVEQFFDVLASAGSCQGLVYSYGDQMVESFMFRSEEDALIAKRWFDGARYDVFPKTMSFASINGVRLYVFHARHNQPSWQSKRDHEKFESFIKVKNESKAIEPA